MGCLGLLLVARRKEGGVEKDGAGEEVGKEGKRNERDEGKKDRVEGGNRVRERSVRERM